MLLMIDNFDSFTFNLVHYFQELGQEVVVKRNNEIDLKGVEHLSPDYIVVSPGPGTPEDSGISMDVIAAFKGKLPILGVCLGHQCIAEHLGAKVQRADKVMHGKTSKIAHNQQGLFRGLPEIFSVTRYHSLMIEPSSLPDCLIVDAHVADSKLLEIMAIRHNKYSLFGVQFHPESVLTDYGHDLLRNFLSCS